MPSLDGAFCGVGIAIDDLKVWQAPKLEQLRPRGVSIFVPDLEEGNSMVDLSTLP